MLRSYKAVCFWLWAFGLRSTARPSPCNTISAYYTDSLHFTNWAFLYEGQHNIPKRNHLTRWKCAYSLGILLLVSVHPAAEVYRLVHTTPDEGHSSFRIANIMFSFIVPMQFVQTYAYLRTDHIEPHLIHTFYDDVDDSHHPFMTSSTSSSASRECVETGGNAIRSIVPVFRRPLTGARQCQMSRLRVIRACVWVTIGVFSTSTIAVAIAEKYNGGREVPLAVDVVGTVGMVLGVVVQSTCVTLFSTVFYNHCVDLLHTCECLSTCHISQCSSSVIMNYLLRHISLLRYSVGTSIQNMHGMFSSFALLWSVGFALCVHSLVSPNRPAIRVDTICYAACYGLVQMLYFTLIHYIHCGKRMVVDAIHVPKFILANLGRSIVSARDVLCIAGKSDAEVCTETANMIERCKLSLLTENASTMDWIAVNNTLQQDWAHFHFMGLSLNDSSMIKRCAALVGVIIGGRYLFSV